MGRKRKLSTVVCVYLLILLAPAAPAQKKAPVPGVERYFESIRKQPLLLGAFLREMPKGADLHNHLSGAIYAESYIKWAAEDGVCIDRQKMALAACEANRAPATSALEDPDLYRDVVNSLSMRDHQGGDTGHDHFFAAFSKFGPVSKTHTGDMLAEVASRAAAENVLYLELMLTPASVGPLADKISWDDNFDAMAQQLGGGVAELVVSAKKAIDAAEARKQALLKCGTPEAQPGCQVTLRFIFQGARAVPLKLAFAQLLAGFAVASADARFAGVNLVMAEDSYIAMRDFDLHMRMLDYLHRKYPKVHIALHAGELTPGMVPPEGLRSHIRDSVERGHAERIGHGADVMYERDPIGLLKEMERRKVLVEICLTSNEHILGMRGAYHPFPMYLKYGVPVTLATDDAGVARIDLSREYRRAVDDYGLRYADVKRMVRASLEHSFLPGQSLWTGEKAARVTAACRGDSPARRELSKGCQAFLDSSERARMQWKLEQQLAAFEARY